MGTYTRGVEEEELEVSGGSICKGNEEEDGIK